eukprot:3467423-Rhodomonas_salina.2
MRTALSNEKGSVKDPTLAGPAVIMKRRLASCPKAINPERVLSESQKLVSLLVPKRGLCENPDSPRLLPTIVIHAAPVPCAFVRRIRLAAGVS